MQNRGRQLSAYYVRYFTFKESFRSSLTKRKSKSRISKLREDVKLLLNGHGLDANDEFILYAYVDAENERSKRLIEEFEFQVAGRFSIIPFSRLFPSRSVKVQESDPSHHRLILASLHEYYKNDQLVSYELFGKRGSYYFIMENGQLICGVQAVIDQWDIIEMPGFTGKLLMNVVPHIPVLNRAFKPNFKFALFELAFCQEGREDQLAILFETVLNKLNVNTGIICADDKSRLYRQVMNIDLGITYKIQGEKKIDIVAKSSTPNFIDQRVPTAISGFDVL